MKPRCVIQIFCLLVLVCTFVLFAVCADVTIGEVPDYTPKYNIQTDRLGNSLSRGVKHSKHWSYHGGTPTDHNLEITHTPSGEVVFSFGGHEETLSKGGSQGTDPSVHARQRRSEDDSSPYDACDYVEESRSLCMEDVPCALRPYASDPDTTVFRYILKKYILERSSLFPTPELEPILANGSLCDSELIRVMWTTSMRLAVVCGENEIYDSGHGCICIEGKHCEDNDFEDDVSDDDDDDDGHNHRGTSSGFYRSIEYKQMTANFLIFIAVSFVIYWTASVAIQYKFCFAQIEQFRIRINTMNELLNSAVGLPAKRKPGSGINLPPISNASQPTDYNHSRFDVIHPRHSSHNRPKGGTLGDLPD